MKKVGVSAFIALSCGALQVPSGAFAGGFQVTELCARCSGSRNAGQVAQASGPATVWFNPAGMTKLDDVELDFSLHYIVSTAEFENLNSTKANGEPSEAAPGLMSSDGGGYAVVPNFYATWRISDRWAVGLGINAPYGTVTEYDDGWVGRYQGLRSEFTVTNTNPSFAFKVNDWFSLGAGINATHVRVDLTGALDVGAIVNYAYGGGGTESDLLPAVSTLENDGFSEVTGDDWGWGWNIGGLFSFNDDRTRLGISYRSMVAVEIDVTLDTTSPEIKAFGITVPGTQQEAKGTTEVDIPATLGLGFSHDFNEHWTLLAGALWTEWKNSFANVEVALEDGGTLVQPENWDDSWAFQLGAEYNLSPQWAFRAGYELDYSPASPEDITARTPDADKQWLALGFTYTSRFGLAIDFAYSRVVLDDLEISDDEIFTEQAGSITAATLPGADPSKLQGVSNTLNGNYNNSGANIFSLGARYIF